MKFNIERWYDRYSKNWIAILKDQEGNQVADAIYVYSKKEALDIKLEDFVLYSHLKESLILEAEGLTIFDLEQGSSLVLPPSQFKTEPNNYRFENTRINYMKGFKSLEYLTQTFNKDTKMHYNTSIAFYNVDDPYNSPPELDKNPVRVSCSCPAYYYYFWYANKQAKVHARGNLRPYIRKTPPPPVGLPHKNPDKIPGLCKHLIAFSNYLNLGDYFLGDKRKFDKV